MDSYIPKREIMKILILYFYIVMTLNANSLKKEKSCYFILQEIDKLEENKDTNTFEKIGVFITTGSFYNSNYKEVETKIRILKLKLLDCK